MNKNNIDSVINKVLNEEFNKRSNLLFEKKMKKDIDEKLVGKQHKIDKNKNGKIDSEDFKLLKKGKSEVKEKLVGKQSKIDKNKNGKIDGEDFKLLKKGKKSVKMTEEELVSFIENIVNEANEIKLGGSTITMTEDELVSFVKDIVFEAKGDNLTKKPKSLTDVESLLRKSKSDNEKNLKDVGKKMTEYIKYGSNGKYVENPDSYPQSNMQLKKSDIMGYRMDGPEEEYVENLGRGPGMENLEYDEVDPNEEWMTDNIEGSSRTGNNPKWANAIETDVNKKMNTKRKKNYYAAEKKRAYQKSQDVHIVQNDDKRPDFIKKMKGESIENNDAILSEEFNKMNKLINYNKITQ
jgi:hypothetical protein